MGHVVNEVRAALRAASDERREALELIAEDALLDADRIDMSLPGRVPKLGSYHPLTIVEREVVDIFTEPRVPGG